jgi:hypothetical protein
MINMMKAILLVWCLVSVTQMSTVWQVKTHESLMRFHDRLVHLQVGGAATESLNIDSPFLRIEVEGLEGTGLAENLNLIDVLVPTIVTLSWVSLRILVGHGRSKSVEDGSGGNVFGGNEEDGLFLTLDLAGLTDV